MKFCLVFLLCNRSVGNKILKNCKEYTQQELKTEKIKTFDKKKLNWFKSASVHQKQKQINTAKIEFSSVKSPIDSFF